MSNLTEKKEYFPRLIMEDLKKWLARREIYAIKGPRQSGKTTLLKILKDYLIEKEKVNPKNIIFFTLEDRDILDKFSQDPKSFIQSFIFAPEEKYYFLIDEFQYLQQGGQRLKLLYDLFDNIKFIITGSSSLELTDQTGKFLVGRLFSFYLFPLSFAEFLKVRDQRLFRVYQEKHSLVWDFITKNRGFPVKKDIFVKDLDRYFQEYVIWGGYPEVVKTKDLETKRMILKNIYDTYITKDIVELLKITDTFRFRNLLGHLANQIGNLVNYNNLALDTQSYFQEVKRQLSILNETYLISTLRPFFTNKATELKKNPKIYFVDTGLRNYLISNFNSLDQRMDKGILVENIVLQQLKTSFEENWQINFWRTLAKAEVDFVLKANKTIIPLEVKYSSFREPKTSRSLQSFISGYEPQQVIVTTQDFWGEKRVRNSLIKFVPTCYL